MSCKNAKYDACDFCYICSITGDTCIFINPNREFCIDKIEGQGKEKQSKNNNVNGKRL
ncbi:MAG: hypothetical protein RSA29_02695 [Clostridium sp.]|uniref:hypothetical protein n=1 Tax=Clostridium sp. TaxID=1506 RepID=UPI00302614E5